MFNVHLKNKTTHNGCTFFLHCLEWWFDVCVLHFFVYYTYCVLHLLYITLFMYYTFCVLHLLCITLIVYYTLCITLFVYYTFLCITLFVYSSPFLVRLLSQKTTPSYQARFQMHWGSKLLLDWSPMRGHPSYKVFLFFVKGVAL